MTQEKMPVQVRAHPDQLRYLADQRAEPQEPVIFMLTEEQYRGMPGAGDIRQDLKFRRELPDGWTIDATWEDAKCLARELLDCYNAENPLGGYDELADLEETSPENALRLIRTTAICLDSESRFRPHNMGFRATEVMKEQGLEPGRVFRTSRQPEGR